MALAVIAAAGGDGASWEMARWTPAQMPGSVSVPVEPVEKPADRAGRQTRLEDEHLYDMRRPGWAPVSLVVAAGETWSTVHLPPLPRHLADSDGAALAALDARDHPGTIEAIVTAATGRVRALGGSLTGVEMDALLEATGWPVEWRAEAKVIAWCESKWSPHAVGDGGNSLGIWQMWTGWFGPAGYSTDQAFEPIVNSRVALYARQVRGRWGGRGGWSCADLLGID